jgi:vitamin-K-epoxide reductase (warfarin-sensitive)
MSAPLRRFIAPLAVAGLIAAASSSYIHLQLVSDPAYTSFCDVSETVSCTDLYQSRFGSVVGVPVALAGVIWFGVVLLLVLADARGPERSREHITSYLLVWSTVGLSVVMYMAYASFFVLGTFCILCGVVYVAVTGIFLMAGSGPATPFHQLPSAFVSDLRVLVRRPVGFFLTVVFVAGAVAAAARFPEPRPLEALAQPTPTSDDTEQADEQRSEFERFWSAQPRADSRLTDVEAPVVVVKFNDYQCPACAQTHLMYGPIFTKYESSHPGSVRLVTRDFPLDPDCNNSSPSGPHAAACDAAVAVRLARRVGDAEARRMEEWLYGNQEGLSRDTITVALAEIAGVDPPEFETRRAGVIDEITVDISIGVDLPVEATPTFVVNGIVLKGGLAPRFFDQAIALELERARVEP